MKKTIIEVPTESRPRLEVLYPKFFVILQRSFDASKLDRGIETCDIVQDVFLSLISRGVTEDQILKNPEALLRWEMRNRVNKLYRKQKRRERKLEEKGGIDVIDVQNSEQSHEDSEYVEHLVKIAAFDDDLTRYHQLRMEGRTQKEISEHLNLTGDETRALYMRYMRTLKKAAKGVSK